jgi:Ca-activated chloride channel family protein
MKITRYSRYTGEDAGAVDLEELLSRLSDFLLGSGFGRSFYEIYEMDPQQTLEQLREAILKALAEGDLLPPDLYDRLFGEAGTGQHGELDQLLDALVQALFDQGYLSSPAPQVLPPSTATAVGQAGPESEAARRARFEITDKTLDFLGYRALRELLGSLGKSSYGRHDTRDLATGIESGGASRPYEFGDTLNLDIPETLRNALLRCGPRLPIEVDYPDLMVHQCEYQSSCATVLMLDCSHSMILYGEDRFTPAKRVALALTHLIRTQYPGDSLHLVLFHDSAEEVPLRQLARVQVGPFYTNTCEGLRLSRRILQRERKDMRQIIMITDGKPSALTLEDGRIYRNAFGLDPLVVSRTLEEVARCRRAGILVNTFMLARDYALIQFVQKVTEICRGKAYFTTPHTLGQYLLLDYMNHKTRQIH